MSSSVDRDDELPLSCYKRKKKNFDYGSNVISDKKEADERSNCSCSNSKIEQDKRPNQVVICLQNKSFS